MASNEYLPIPFALKQGSMSCKSMPDPPMVTDTAR